MTNSDNGWSLQQELLRTIEEVYTWPDLPPQKNHESKVIVGADSDSCVGEYELRSDLSLTINRADDHLFCQILIHALLFEKSEPSYRIETMLHERSFKNHPIKIKYKEETKTLVPDAYLAFAYTGHNRKEETIPILWELDRGTEDQKFFQRRIRSYIVFLKSRAFKTLFGIENITVAFATTRDHNRVRQMREWAQKEFTSTNEPGWQTCFCLLCFLKIWVRVSRANSSLIRSGT